MKIATIGIVTGTNSYEREGVVTSTVSVGCHGGMAFNVRLPDVSMFQFGQVVSLMGELKVNKAGSFLEEAVVMPLRPDVQKLFADGDVWNQLRVDAENGSLEDFGDEGE